MYRFHENTMEVSFLKNASVLINCDLGKEYDVLETLRKIKSVKEAHGTFVAYDIIGVVSDNAANLQENIIWKIRKLSFVRTTLTLIGTG